MNEADDILIQRCIDNELSASERRDLLSKLDAIPGGWKSLACGFVEDQLFAVAANSDTPRAGASVSTVAPSTQKTHWFNHPVTSLVLSVCVAFLAGILIRGEMSSGASSLPVVDQSEMNESAVSNVATANGTEPSAPLSPDGDIKVRLVGDGMESQVLPIYSPRDYPRGAENDWRRILESMQRRTEGTQRSGSQMIVLNINGQTYVIPVEEFESSPVFQ